MSDKNLALSRRIINSVRGHLRVALIAVVFGMTAYGFIYMLFLIINYVKQL